MSNYKTFQLNDCGEIVSGGTPSSSISSFWKGDINWITPADLSKLRGLRFRKTKRRISDAGLRNSSAVLVPAESVVISSRAPIGYIAIGDVPFSCNQGCKIIVPNRYFDSSYLAYNLLHHIDEVKKFGEGTTFSEISRTSLVKVKLPFPPLPQQRKIAKILSTADAQIEATEQLIAKYKMVKEGLMQNLFTRGIDLSTGKLRPKYQDAPHLYKESPLGMIPKEWEVESLQHVCGMKSGEGITSNSIQEAGNYPVYGGNGLRGFTSDFTHEGEYILIGRQGALCGNVVRVSNKFFASEHAVVVTTYEETDVDWLSQKLAYMNLNQYSEASAQPGLSVSKILKLKIAAPQHKEQQLIAERFLQLDLKLEAEQRHKNYMHQLKQGLMQDLLSGKKEVKIQETDEALAPAAEPAVEYGKELL